MAAAPRRWAAELLHLWFDTLEAADWFGSGADVDALLKTRFEHDLLMLGSQPAHTFLDDPQVAQAAILLFDQIPRNIYRGDAAAFTHDPLARAIAKAFIARGWDDGLPDHERQFAAMPLMHSEDLADQEASLAYFSKHLPGNAEFARSHHEMIARFGRFPHRNAALGRQTTEAEQRAIDSGFSW